VNYPFKLYALHTPDQQVAKRHIGYHTTRNRRREDARSEQQLISKQKICKVFEISRIRFFFKLSLFTSEEMDSDKQEEQKPVKMESVEDYSENRSDPDEPLRVKLENTEEQIGWCLFSIFH